MGTGYGECTMCYYDVVPCTDCSCKDSPLQNWINEYYPDEESEE